jgi:RNA polymerase sigma factor (sigma-70 family)
MDETLDDWFKREILAHEAALVRYLSRWPNRDEVHDLRQEVYVRVYEAAARARPTSAKSFLFTTARHLMTDRVRRSRIISIEGVADLDALNVMVDDVSPEQRVHARQELNLLARAFARLSPKCREVIWMRRVDQLSQKEVASRLGVTESSVEKHVIKGTRLLADAVFGRNTLIATERTNPQGQQEETAGDESEHGKQ